MKKNTIIWGVAGILIVIAVLFATGIFSVLDTFDNCRIVKEGDVCSDYTECLYDLERDISCIKGYEDKTPIYNTSIDLFEDEVVDGEKESCVPDYGYDNCFKTYGSDVWAELHYTNFPATYYEEDDVYYANPDGYFSFKLKTNNDDVHLYYLDGFNGFTFGNGLLLGEYIFVINQNEYSQNFDINTYIPDYGMYPARFISSHDGGFYSMGYYAGGLLLKSDVQCVSDIDCGTYEYCDNDNPYETQCSELFCEYDEQVRDHKCIKLSIPSLCQNADIFDLYDCANYLNDYIDILEGEIDDLIIQINQLEITIEEKIELINQLNLQIDDVTIAINTLNLTIQENILLIESLELTVSEQAELINNLELTVEEQAQIILGLQDTIEGQALLISQLELTYEENALLIAEMELTIEENAQLISELEYAIENAVELISQLELTVEEQALLISELQLTVEEQAQLISELQLTVEQQAQLILELELTIEQQAQLISELELTVEQQAQLISQLELTIEEQAQLISELRVSILEKIQIINGLELTIEENLKLIQNMYVKINELGEIIAGLEISIEEQANLIESLGLTIEENIELIDSMELTIEENIELIKHLKFTITEKQALVVVLADDLYDIEIYSKRLELENHELIELYENVQKEDMIRTSLLVGGVIALLGVLYYYVRKKK